MLKKNIYIIYPAGYYGTYLQWAICKTENDLSTNTIDDPLNRNSSAKLGGFGTAHLHERIPTHQDILRHMSWMIVNQPTEKKIFLINAHHTPNNNVFLTPEWTINMILQTDRDPIIITIHDDNDMDIRKQGSINTLMKWPIFFKANQMIKEKYPFDSFNCKDSNEARNLFAENYANIFPYASPISHSLINDYLSWYNKWYDVRNQYNSHEVNKDLYVVPEVFSHNMHYTLPLSLVCKPDFIYWLSYFIQNSNSGDYDPNMKFVQNYHQTYVDAQKPYTQWINEIDTFRKTYQLTEYLESHSLLQAYVIMELLPKLPKRYDWKSKSLKQILRYCKTNAIL